MFYRDGTSSKGGDSSKGKHDKILSKEERERLEHEQKKQAEREAKKLEQELEAKVTFFYSFRLFITLHAYSALTTYELHILVNLLSPFRK